MKRLHLDKRYGTRSIRGQNAQVSQTKRRKTLTAAEANWSQAILDRVDKKKGEMFEKVKRTEAKHLQSLEKKYQDFDGIKGVHIFTL